MSHPPGPPSPGYDPGTGPPGSGPGYPPGGPPVVTTNGKATAAVVTGITTLVLSWCCGFGLVGIVAVVLGVRARTEIARSGGRQDGDGLALAGVITGAVATVIGLAALVAIGIAVSRTGGDLTRYQ